MVVEDALNIFTDGSSLPTPRRGGVGIRFVQIDSSGHEQTIDIELPGYKNATNNQMELYACIMALKEALKLEALSTVRKIVIHTDSQYVVNNYKKAMFTWPKWRWHTSSGRPVLNADLWKDLVKSIRNTGKRVDFIWEKEQAKHIHSKAVDRLVSCKNDLT
jgi:ribonuclease HI